MLAAGAAVARNAKRKVKQTAGIWKNHLMYHLFPADALNAGAMDVIWSAVNGQEKLIMNYIMMLGLVREKTIYYLLN